MKPWNLVFALAAALACATSAQAQVPPTAAETAAYQGLHAAAARGVVPRLTLLTAARADVNARDGHGRTPLHVATYARQAEAIRALVQAGADLNALENDRYDAVTIAAVADDEATLRVLLQLGASAKQVTSRYDGTALIAAAHLGHDGVVRQLIAAGAPLDHVNNRGPVHTIFIRCVAIPKGQAPGAERSWGAAPARLGNAAHGPLASQPEGKAALATPLVVAFLAKAPALASSRALIGVAGAAFALVKIV